MNSKVGDHQEIAFCLPHMSEHICWCESCREQEDDFVAQQCGQADFCRTYHQRSPPVVIQNVGIGIESQQRVNTVEVPEASCIVQSCVAVAAAPFVDLCPFPDKILDPAVIAILPARERVVDCVSGRYISPH